MLFNTDSGPDWGGQFKVKLPFCYFSHLYVDFTHCLGFCYKFPIYFHKCRWCKRCEYPSTKWFQFPLSFPSTSEYTNRKPTSASRCSQRVAIPRRWKQEVLSAAVEPHFEPQYLCHSLCFSLVGLQNDPASFSLQTRILHSKRSKCANRSVAAGSRPACVSLPRYVQLQLLRLDLLFLGCVCVLAIRPVCYACRLHSQVSLCAHVG